MEHYLRKWNGEVLGKISEHGDRLEAYTWRGEYVGWYDKTYDETHEWNGAIIGKGNLLAVLITQHA